MRVAIRRDGSVADTEGRDCPIRFPAVQNLLVIIETAGRLPG
jgi:hypothetical protein